jgi:hypothetical protein
MSGREKYPDCQWDLAQIRSFVAHAKARVGADGWKFISDEMRKAIISEEVLKVVFASVSVGLEVKWIRDLYTAMMTEAGLLNIQVDDEGGAR